MLSAPEGSVIDDAQFFRSIEYRVYEVGGDVGEYQEGRKGYRRQCEHRQKRYPPAELLPHYGGVIGFRGDVGSFRRDVRRGFRNG